MVAAERVSCGGVFLSIGSDSVRGLLDLVILKLILEKDRYGYELAKEIARRTDHGFEIKEATLYAVVQRLERRELITSYIGEKTHGGKRRYYTVTTLGKAYYQEKTREWEHLKKMMADILEVDDERDS